MSTLSYGEIFDRAWGRMRERLPLVAGLTLVYLLASMVFGNVPALGALFHAVFHAGYVICLIKICEEKDMTAADFFWAFADIHRFAQMVLLWLLLFIMLFLGYVCLVIPGIYLTVALSLAAPYFVTQEQDAVAAIKASMRLTRDHWWPMAGLLIFVGLLNLAGALCFIVGLLFSVPMSVLILLEALKVLEGASPAPTKIVEAKVVTAEKSDF